jgi:flagellar L-ring protein FlgH
MNHVILFALLTLVSCANYVDQVHRQIDREEKGTTARRAEAEENGDHFAYYRRLQPEKDKRPVKNPVTYSLSDGGPSAGGQVRPPVKRDYRPQRYKTSDFQDNDNDGSLWANQGSSSSLFTYQNDKHTGDMVIINVLENLRNQISSELKTTFAEKPKKGAPGAPAAPAAGGAAPAAPAAGADNETDLKVYDKISGTVMEEISKDYILLRGRKEVIFKKEKRSIEVQALVSRKDIMENDYVNSDKLLESKVYILRNNQ